MGAVLQWGASPDGERFTDVLTDAARPPCGCCGDKAGYRFPLHPGKKANPASKSVVARRGHPPWPEFWRVKFCRECGDALCYPCMTRLRIYCGESALCLKCQMRGAVPEVGYQCTQVELDEELLERFAPKGGM